MHVHGGSELRKRGKRRCVAFCRAFSGALLFRSPLLYLAVVLGGEERVTPALRAEIEQ